MNWADCVVVTARRKQSVGKAEPAAAVLVKARNGRSEKVAARVGDVVNKRGLGKLSRPRCQIQWRRRNDWCAGRAIKLEVPLLHSHTFFKPEILPVVLA